MRQPWDGWHVVAGTAEPARGVRGHNYVRDPAIHGYTWIVRSIWVHAQAGSLWPDDYVEMGWCKGLTCCGLGGYCTGEPPHHFVAWKKEGEYDEQMIGVALPYTTHEYNVVNRWGTYWRWWLDGYLKLENDQTFTVGNVGGQSEVHNECDSAYTRWWDLKSFALWMEWRDWSYLFEVLDDNPDYHLEKVSNTEFKVVAD